MICCVLSTYLVITFITHHPFCSWLPSKKMDKCEPSTRAKRSLYFSLLENENKINYYENNVHNGHIEPLPIINM
jgi:hypothetical protein